MILTLITIALTTGVSYYFFRVQPMANVEPKSKKVVKPEKAPFDYKSFFSKWNKKGVLEKSKRIKIKSRATHKQQSFAHKKTILNMFRKITGPLRQKL